MNTRRGCESSIPKYDVCDVFSPPRMCAAANRHGLRGGWSIGMAVSDPSTGRKYDLRDSMDQGEVKRLIRRDCPTVLVVSPPCTAFSIANQGEVDKRVLAGAIEMIRFSIEICELQHRSGRHFIFEQPQSSRAWSLGEVIKLTYRDGVTKTTFHQCMYGLEARNHEGAAPAYKPTSVLTNHPALVEVLQERCDGSHRHAQLIGKSACTQAARYPSGLCTAVMKGVQVIRKRLEEIASVRDKVHEANLCESVGGGSFTDPLFTDGGLDVCPEDVLYEDEMEDM